jgi:hypothetical protein
MEVSLSLSLVRKYMPPRAIRRINGIIVLDIELEYIFTTYEDNII